MSDSEREMIGIMELVSAKRLREKLAENGVEIEIGHNKQTCTSGCRVTVEVWAKSEDILKVQEKLAEEHMKLLEGLDFDLKQISQVFDPKKETAVCPACGAEFSTDLKECPDCGLVFVSDK